MGENNRYTSDQANTKTTLESKRGNGNPFIGKNAPREGQER